MHAHTHAHTSHTDPPTQADQATQLTFAEFVDIAALLNDADMDDRDLGQQSAEFDFGPPVGQQAIGYTN